MVPAPESARFLDLTQTVPAQQETPIGIRIPWNGRDFKNGETFTCFLAQLTLRLRPPSQVLAKAPKSGISRLVFFSPSRHFPGL